MLSYQHAYHAGNAADLHKHIVLAELLAALTAKPRGITYAESHAGRGLYDLASPEARKTKDAEGGIARIEPDPDSPFGRALAAARAVGGASAYPGSPHVARSLLRPQDRMVLMELHAAEHAALAQTFASAPGVAIHRRDGFEGLLALAPFTPRRGLVLVDPSYEVKADYAAVAVFAAGLLRKWPEATVLIWYPLLAAGRHAVLRDGLAALPHALDEVRFRTAPERGMQGSGLALLNAPHGAEAAFARAHAAAAAVLVPMPVAPGRRRV